MSLELACHPAQDQFLKSPSRVRGFVGGRGSGKTFVGALDLIMRAKHGRLYMIVSPTYTMLKDTCFRTFKKLAELTGSMISINQHDMVVKIRAQSGTAEVLFRSGDNPERLRGPNLTGAWLDEASVMDREVYEIMLASMRADGEVGWLSATFTPKGRSHWTYELFGKNVPGVDLISSRTFDNPFLPASFYDGIKSHYGPMLARQELEGEFVELEGSEWPNAYFDDHIWYDQGPTSFEVSVIGVDPSKGKDSKSGDYSAFVFLGVDREGMMWVDSEVLRIPAPLIPQLTLDLYRRWRPDVIAIETNQFQELLLTELMTEGATHGIALPCVPIDNRVNKVVRIRRLGPYLARKQIRFKKESNGCDLLVRQLQDFPEGKHDDAIDALEIATRQAAGMLVNNQEREYVENPY